MRRSAVLLFTLLLSAVPLGAANDRHESYVSFDDGSTTIVQEGRDIEARVNMPVFGGDEIRSGRRGRSEIRLSDGNVIALDRDTIVRLRSIAGSYDGETDETILSLKDGQLMVQRTDYSSSVLRLDSPAASYVGSRNSIYAVEIDRNGVERIAVFEGSVEVRTERGSERVRSGEEAKLDDDGVYAETSLASGGSSDFQRWYLRRAQRYDKRSSAHLDSRFAHWDSDLNEYGSWIYVHEYGTQVWRPRVTVGWRPYYYGRWTYGPRGSMIWASDEPWGWLPYHYGRWAYAGLHGWVWLPGSVYSPAWVYWAYTPGYVGWAPAGWYDCHPPYYSWMYGRNQRVGIDYGFGFYGRVNFRDVDLRGWTFAGSNTLVSTRVDRAALTTDMIRDRLTRDGATLTVGSGATRFTRDQLKDPAGAIQVINRSPSGGGTGKGDSGSLTDMTSFFRRDPELPTTVRERLTRGGGTAPAAGRGTATAGSGGAIGRGDSGAGSTATGRGAVDRNGVITRGGGSPAAGGTRGGSDRGGVITRGGEGTTSVPRGGAPAAATPRGTIDRDTDWRTRVARPRDTESVSAAPATRADDWRGRGGVRSGTQPAPRAGEETTATPRTIRRGAPATGDAPPTPRSRDSVDPTPRRIIDRINGDRVERRDTGSRAATPRTTTERPSSRSSDRPAAVERPKPSSAPSRSEGSSRSRSSNDSDKSDSGRSTNIKRD